MFISGFSIEDELLQFSLYIVSAETLFSCVIVQCNFLC